ncbi:hypothetical protein HMF8227_02415 [Saliniradius amylolyticus]|uniref:VCBS repeat-containing protein n=1 Tax=Saliniradius amylolyticus TaxID=2183582 RepID=A0A2S2E7C9_9ALTE|nr:hypothetical protein [Saliniradius amylolyticus]AWL12867.1 hypothetical protein HMF8227_02415 [Saliniradius amylolyticus]
MQIINSELKLSNQHRSKEQHSRIEAALGQVPRAGNDDNDRVEISQMAAILERMTRQELSISAASSPLPSKIQSNSSPESISDDNGLPPKFRTLKFMIELLSGEKLDMSLLNRLRSINESQNRSSPSIPETPPRVSNNNEPEVTELVYVKEQSYWSQENQFSASGKIELAGGQQLSFEFDSYFGQSFYSESTQLLTRDQLKDPLVLSFDGGPVRVTGDTHDFDLNGDGKQNSVAILDRGSAYLALDRNQDGIVNDGLELFGARTNNGFAELAELDEDGNGFIDSGDSIYDQLQLWFKSTDADKLQSLAGAGVAAISLDHISTPFRLMDEHQQQQGVIRQSGVFIDQQGHGGLVQQIDLKI